MFIILVLISIIPYSISTWLIWQNMKEGTILPYGSSTGRHGQSIGWGIKLLYLGVLIAICLNYGWIFLASFPITWFISGWIATIIERKVYMKLVLRNLNDLSKMYINTDYDYAVSMLSLPNWWVRMMPNDWKREYLNVLEKLKS